MPNIPREVADNLGLTSFGEQDIYLRKLRHADIFPTLVNGLPKPRAITGTVGSICLGYGVSAQTLPAIALENPASKRRIKAWLAAFTFWSDASAAAMATSPSIQKGNLYVCPGVKS